MGDQYRQFFRVGNYCRQEELIPAQCGDAGAAIDIASVAAPRIDISRGRAATVVVGVKIGIQHAGRARPLQFACIAVANVEPGWAELADQRVGIGADHPAQPGFAQRGVVRGMGLRLADGGCRRRHYAPAARGQHQHQGYRQDRAHYPPAIARGTHPVNRAGDATVAVALHLVASAAKL